MNWRRRENRILLSIALALAVVFILTINGALS